MALGPAPKQTVTRIVGIVLVRNEDRFVQRAVENALAFCDEMLLVDNGSTDGTLQILQAIAANSQKTSLHKISHPRESHDLLKKFVGTPTWVFGVDGDEIYDPAGLEKFRAMVISGQFNSHWMVLGNVLHCDSIESERAHGFLAPPSRSITKFYNFAAIDSWEGDTPERLHAGSPVFRQGFSENAKRRLETEFSWDNSPLRCLHTCFMTRSSSDAGVDSRENIMETYRGGLTNWIRRTARRFAGRPEKSLWKHERYARGERVGVDARPFFPEGEC
jgi:glycosyltransferase involved in cell wall biosynthesis